eukprot:scaffold191215_cov21-Tisochrysis_lutea.AAC.1
MFDIEPLVASKEGALWRLLAEHLDCLRSKVVCVKGGCIQNRHYVRAACGGQGRHFMEAAGRAPGFTCGQSKWCVIKQQHAHHRLRQCRQAMSMLHVAMWQGLLHHTKMHVMHIKGAVNAACGHAANSLMCHLKNAH